MLIIERMYVVYVGREGFWNCPCGYLPKRTFPFLSISTKVRHRGKSHSDGSDPVWRMVVRFPFFCLRRLEEGGLAGVGEDAHKFGVGFGFGFGLTAADLENGKFVWTRPLGLPKSKEAWWKLNGITPLRMGWRQSALWKRGEHKRAFCIFECFDIYSICFLCVFICVFFKRFSQRFSSFSGIFKLEYQLEKFCQLFLVFIFLADNLQIFDVKGPPKN